MIEINLLNLQDKIKINGESLSKREITVKGFHDKRGVRHLSHKRKIKGSTPKEVAPKEVSVEVVEMEEKPITTMTPENVKEEIHLDDMGAEGGANSMDTSVLVFNDDSHAIYKTSGREEMLGEIAAYEVSKIIGWDVIPETVGGYFARGEGSCQKWVEGGKVTAYYPNSDCDVLQENHIDDLAKIFVLDMVNGNNDRHAANTVVKDDRVYAIDNEILGRFGTGRNACQALSGNEGNKMLNWLRYVPIPEFKDKVVVRIKDYMKVILKKRKEIMNHYVDKDTKTIIIGNIERNFDSVELYLEDHP